MARAPKGKKARKAAPVKARVKKRSMARLQAIAPDTGPVTLEEARALARAKRPTLAFQDVGKTAAPPASPAAVGAARQKLKKEQRDERARNIVDDVGEIIAKTTDDHTLIGGHHRLAVAA